MTMLFHLIPGIAILLEGIKTPPGNKILFGGVTEAFGVLSLFLLYICTNKIKNINDRKIIKWAIGLAICTFVFLAAYLCVFDYCVVPYDYEGKQYSAYFPIYLDANLRKMMEDDNGRDMGKLWAINKYGITEINDQIKAKSIYLTITTILLLSLYQGTLLPIAIAFGIIGFHEKMPIDDQGMKDNSL